MTLLFPVFSYRSLAADSKVGMAKCGDDPGYQMQNQLSLSANTIQLLSEGTDQDLATDPQMADLAHKVNEFFAAKAKVLLNQKRAQLTAEGKGDIAKRVEVTVFLTERGLQLGYAYALPRKELAPMPKQSILRRALGPLYPGRKYWVMPETEADGPGKTYTVWWPWVFWAVVLALLGVGGVMLMPASPVEAAPADLFAFLAS